MKAPQRRQFTDNPSIMFTVLAVKLDAQLVNALSRAALYMKWADLRIWGVLAVFSADVLMA